MMKQVVRRKLITWVRSNGQKTLNEVMESAIRVSAGTGIRVQHQTKETQSHYIRKWAFIKGRRSEGRFTVISSANQTNYQGTLAGALPPNSLAHPRGKDRDSCFPYMSGYCSSAQTLSNFLDCHSHHSFFVVPILESSTRVRDQIPHSPYSEAMRGQITLNDHMEEEASGEVNVKRKGKRKQSPNSPTEANEIDENMRERASLRRRIIDLGTCWRWLRRDVLSHYRLHFCCERYALTQASAYHLPYCFGLYREWPHSNGQ